MKKGKPLKSNIIRPILKRELVEVFSVYGWLICNSENFIWGYRDTSLRITPIYDLLSIRTESYLDAPPLLVTHFTKLKRRLLDGEW